MSGQCLSPSEPGHALTPGTHLWLGEPLPHQQPDRTFPDPKTRHPRRNAPLPAAPCGAAGSSGITSGFPELSPILGHVRNALLARSPLYLRAEAHFRVRLACFSHAASVRAEPGSNSSIEIRSRCLAINQTPWHSKKDSTLESVGPSTGPTDRSRSIPLTQENPGAGVDPLAQLIFDFGSQGC